MDLAFTDTQLLLRKTLREYFEREIDPLVGDMEAERLLPYEPIRKLLADLGLGPLAAAEIGGERRCVGLFGEMNDDGHPARLGSGQPVPDLALDLLGGVDGHRQADLVDLVTNREARRLGSDSRTDAWSQGGQQGDEEKGGHPGQPRPCRAPSRCSSVRHVKRALPR